MLKSKKYILLIIGIYAARTALAAESISILEAGIFGGASSNSHVVNFVDLPGFTTIGQPYEPSTALGVSGGLYGEYRLSSLFGFQLRLGYLPLSTELKSREFIGNQEVNGELVHVYSNYLLKPSLSMVSASPIVVFKPFDNLGLFVSFGANLGMFIENTAGYSEYLDDEVYQRGIEYNNGSIGQGQTRNAMSGDLYVNKIIYSVVPGIGYKFKLSDKFNIALQADYNYWLINVYPMKEWELRNSTITFNISYSIISEEIERIEEPQDIYELPPKKPVLSNLELPEKTVNDRIAEKIPEEQLATDKPINKDTMQTVNDRIAKHIDTPSKLIINDCYYIIFATSESVAEINKLLKIYKNAGFEDINIQEYYDNKDKISYHRLCSRCYTNPHDAISYYDRLSLNQDITKTLSGYYIKLGDNNEK